MTVTTSNPLHASPAKRALIDEQRKREREAKRGLNPGPGSYDVKAAERTSAALAGSSAFKSKLDRKSDMAARDSVAPGAYNPFDHSTMVAQSAKSHNKLNSTGVGGFGAKAKRDGVRDFSASRVAKDGPGPGTYDSKLPGSPEAKQGSSFASQTKRGAHVPKAVTPGAGEYEARPVQESISGGDSMFKNRDERFKKSVELEYASHVGPGSYSQGDNTVEVGATRTAGRVSRPFASEEPRDTRIW